MKRAGRTLPAATPDEPPPVRIHVAREDSLLLPRPEQGPGDKPPNLEQPRLAFYRRRSFRTDTNATLSRQLQRMEQRADALGGRFQLSADLYEDDDLSAKGGTFRPGVESLLAAIQAGRYDGVVVWEFSRWTRNRRENRIMTHVMRTHGCELFSCEEEWLSLHGPMGMLVEWAADLAARESERISERITAWHEAMAHVGAMRAAAPFGTVKVEAPSPWPDRQAPIKLLAPDTRPRPEYGGSCRADLVREAFSAVDRGESVLSIVTLWNSRGWPNAKGDPWSPITLRKMLKNPHYAGYAVRHGAILYDKDRKPLAPHDPVVAPSLFHRVQPVRLRPRPSPRDSPLRGLFRCGTCGATMSYAPRGGGDGLHVYRCVAIVSARCPQRMYVTAEHAERHMLATVTALLSDEDRLAAAVGSSAARARERAEALEAVRRAEDALLRLQRDRVRGDYEDPGGQSRYEALKEELVAEANVARQRLERASVKLPRHVMSVLDAHETVEAALQAMTVAQRRHLVQHLVGKVVVGPRQAKGRTFDPSRLTIVWRQD